ncbi:MAG: hypothetical protein Q8P18_02055 [Pseudomonadota bacterium]|nr:hypothetical protein [Pseudomonadota bacterium]
MDRALLRRKALFAAGSVVLAATLSACPTPKADSTDTASADTAADTDTDVGDGSPDCTETDTAADTAALVDCCSARAEWCEDAHGSGTDAASACTYGPDFDGSTGCIPWGPPVPPRFRGALTA